MSDELTVMIDLDSEIVECAECSFARLTLLIDRKELDTFIVPLDELLDGHTR